MAAVVVDDGADDDSILIKDLFENAEHDVVGICLRSLRYIMSKCHVLCKSRSVQ